ncbi:MAG: UTP--glucose-1-phosphate uridylyltransferase GalU [Bryobacteraceae bacterium]|nr:UTP--glucose-1-phosphate uridylyltransferase GalU [Bryobacteraceae bacterium]
MHSSVRKAVFPAAGLGTRFLPATKSVPKEMLSLVDKPLIQYGVEECAAAGLTQTIIVTSRGKTTIEDHFDLSYELEQVLERRGKADLLEAARAVARLTQVSYVRQAEALGLGHAVLCAREQVGPEPFAVVLSDDVIQSVAPCVGQLAAVHAKYGASVIALMEVPREQISSYGSVDAEEVSPGLYRIRSLVEKPKPAEAPSNLAIIGRYILTPAIFDSLTRIKPGAGGEIQLTDGMRHLLGSEPIYGLKFEGKRFDAGDKQGFLRATVEFGLAHPTLGGAFRDYLRGVTL